MESIETIIPDNEGNHLVIVLSFYDDNDKTGTFQIPQEFVELDIADISIDKLHIDLPLNLSAFFKMCQWLIDQFSIFPNAVLSFICSTDPLETHHSAMASEQYRWNLFENLYQRNIPKLTEMGIESGDRVKGYNCRNRGVSDIRTRVLSDKTCSRYPPGYPTSHQ